MIKKLTKHTIYEVWNEWAAESVFIDHKPSKKDIREVVIKKWYSSVDCGGSGMDVEEHIRRFVRVEKLKSIYTDDNSKEFLKMGIVKRSNEPLGDGKCKRCKKPIHPNLSCEDLGFEE